MAQSNTTLFATPIDNGRVPKEGPRSISITYDFSAGVQSYQTDMTSVKQLGKITALQSVFIDNSVNTQPIVLTVAGTNQSISVPANYQGVFPLFVGGQALFTVTSTGNKQATIQYCNVEQSASLWQAIAVPFNPSGTITVTDPILDNTVSNNRQNVTTMSAALAITDRSGTIAAANTAQVLMAANAARQGWSLQNIDEVNLEELRYCQTGNATTNAPGSFVVAAAGGLNYPGGFVQGSGTNAISIIGATAGHKFTATEW